MHCLSFRVLEQDGLEGSFGIFGLSASLAGMPNVPESEGMVWVGIICQRFLIIDKSQLLKPANKSKPYVHQD